LSQSEGKGAASGKKPAAYDMGSAVVTGAMVVAQFSRPSR